MRVVYTYLIVRLAGIGTPRLTAASTKRIKEIQKKKLPNHHDIGDRGD